MTNFKSQDVSCVQVFPGPVEPHGAKRLPGIKPTKKARAAKIAFFW